MKITQVRIVASDDERVAAYASITIDDSFVVHGLRVEISNKGDYFLFMPGRRQADGTVLAALTRHGEKRYTFEHQAKENRKTILRSSRFSRKGKVS
jgi:DNA-binding cell septation regulator SpoVG